MLAEDPHIFTLLSRFKVYVRVRIPVLGSPDLAGAEQCKERSSRIVTLQIDAKSRSRKRKSLENTVVSSVLKHQIEVCVKNDETTRYNTSRAHLSCIQLRCISRLHIVLPPRRPKKRTIGMGNHTTNLLPLVGFMYWHDLMLEVGSCHWEHLASSLYASVQRISYTTEGTYLGTP